MTEIDGIEYRPSQGVVITQVATLERAEAMKIAAEDDKEVVTVQIFNPNTPEDRAAFTSLALEDEKRRYHIFENTPGNIPQKTGVEIENHVVNYAQKNNMALVAISCAASINLHDFWVRVGKQE